MKYITNHTADVGGGSVTNGTRYSLARIPLRWMIRECFRLDIGILFHRDMFKQIGMDPASLYPHVLPRPPPVYQSRVPSAPGSPDSTVKALMIPRPKVVNGDPTVVVYSDGGDFVNEELEEVSDATSPAYDQLRDAYMWWALEVIPQPLHYQDDDNDSWIKEYKCVHLVLPLVMMLTSLEGLIWEGAATFRANTRSVSKCIGRSKFVWRRMVLKVENTGRRQN
jgi:hypothetical protein